MLYCTIKTLKTLKITIPTLPAFPCDSYVTSRVASSDIRKFKVLSGLSRNFLLQYYNTTAQKFHVSDIYERLPLCEIHNAPKYRISFTTEQTLYNWNLPMYFRATVVVLCPVDTAMTLFLSVLHPGEQQIVLARPPSVYSRILLLP